MILVNPTHCHDNHELSKARALANRLNAEGATGLSDAELDRCLLGRACAMLA